eukprot:sb/3462796/
MTVTTAAQWEKDLGIFPRVPTELSLPAGRRRRKLAGAGLNYSQHSINMVRDINTVCQRISSYFKTGPHPRTIHNKTVGRIVIQDSFFGKDMVSGLIEEKWASKPEDAVFLCDQIMIRHGIIKPVFPFISRFYDAKILYTFTADCKADLPDTERDSCRELAVDICEQWMTEQQLQSRVQTRRRSSESGNRFSRRSSTSSCSPGSAGGGTGSGSSSSSSGDKNTVTIPGDLLIRMVASKRSEQVGRNRMRGAADQQRNQALLRMCDLMLRHGFIKPCLEYGNIFSTENEKFIEELEKKQVFYAQNINYQFNETIVKLIQSKKLKLKAHSIDTGLRAANNLPKTEEVLTPTISGQHSIRVKAYTLEHLDTLDKPLFFTKPSSIGEEGGGEPASPTRRVSAPVIRKQPIRSRTCLFGRKVSRWMTEQQLQSRVQTRRRSSESGNRFSRRSSTSSCSPGSAGGSGSSNGSTLSGDKNTVTIPGDLLIRMVASKRSEQVGRNRMRGAADQQRNQALLRMCDLMLRHGFIKPCLEYGNIFSTENEKFIEELEKKQVFYAQNINYQFNETIVKLIQSKKLKLKAHSIDTGLRAANNIPKTEGQHSIRVKAYTLEHLDTLDKPLFFTKPSSIGEEGGGEPASPTRRVSAPVIRKQPIRSRTCLFGRKVSR